MVLPGTERKDGKNFSLKMSRGSRGALVTYCHVTNYPKLTGFNIAKFTISWFVEATRLGENISLVKLTQVLCCQGYKHLQAKKMLQETHSQGVDRKPPFLNT